MKPPTPALPDKELDDDLSLILLAVWADGASLAGGDYLNNGPFLRPNEAFDKIQKIMVYKSHLEPLLEEEKYNDKSWLEREGKIALHSEVQKMNYARNALKQEIKEKLGL